ncbi:MAG: type II secretion system F family protein [Candidatus Dadabacteria bacterium]|nr:MAG: type II secretion system F family protein [Candidatus Dadabacteria bacterium]
MPVFVWEGRDASGRKVKGEIEARDARSVFNALKARRIMPNASKIREKGTGLDRELKMPGFGSSVKPADIVIFTRQFSTMINAGLPIVQALDILAKQAENPALKDVLTGVKESVETGSTLYESLAQFPEAFGALYVNMVAAGEGSGALDVILNRLATHMEKTIKLNREVKTAMIYPSVVIATAIIVTTILLIFVIPTFAEMFSDFGQALPLPTQIVINISNGLVDNWIPIFGTAAVLLVLLVRFARTERGKEVIHPILLKLPLLGPIVQKVSIARFSRTLATMISSGVPLLEALNICAKTAGNKVVERDVMRARVGISEGKSIVDPLSASTVFPPMVVQMIAVGEQTGAMDSMLSKIADFYESEVDTAVAGLKQLIEPIIIVVLGVIVGGIIIAMYLPIFKLGSVVG